MPTTGRIKFFGRSAALAADGADASASGGGASVDNILSFDRDGYWQSPDLVDGTVSTITVDFGREKTIDRLFLLGTNFKNPSISFVGADIAEAVNVDNLLVPINPYANNLADTIYLEFPPAKISGLGISVSETVVPNNRKILRQVIPCSEIGTMVGYPILSSLSLIHI